MLNSIMNMWLVVTFTPHLTYKQRKRVIRKSMFVATASIFAFAIIGQVVLTGLGITMAAMKITGALLIAPAAYEMVVGHSIDNKESDRKDLHFFPIGIPTIAGPGVFTTVLFLFESNPSFMGIIQVSLAILSACYVTYLILNIGNKFGSLLNSTYIRMLSIFFGTILLSLAMQFLVDGINIIAHIIKISIS